MTVRNARFSDVSGKVIADRDAVTIVVQDHPLIDEPVALDLSREEAESMDVETDDYVVVDIILGERRERVVMKQAAFDGMFTTMPVDEALSGAARYWKQSGKAGKVSGAGDRP